MALLDDVKTVLGIESIDISRDNLLNIYIRKGVKLITNYMNDPNPPVFDPLTLELLSGVDVTVVYADALIEYVILCYRKKGNEGLKSFGLGSSNRTYEDGLSQTVKDLLPSPYIKMARAGW